MTQPYQDKRDSQQNIRDNQKNDKKGDMEKKQHGFHKPQDPAQKGKTAGNEEHQQRTERNKPIR
jgi:hypothetical protein